MIAKGLQAYRGTKNRLQLIDPAYSGATVLLDAYNANPLSLEKALEAIRHFSKQDKCLVLADMGELGEDAQGWHEKAAELAKKHGITRLLTYGTLAKHAQTKFAGAGSHYDTMETLKEALRDILHNDMVVLIKGSRSMQLEKLTEVVLAKEGV